MRAIYLNKYGDANNAFELKEALIPTPTANEVVIKVHSFGLNFADIVARRGLYPDAPKNPSILGYDVSGIVHAIGNEISHVEEGDKVVAMTRFGGYAEYSVTMGEGVAKIPANLDYAHATALATQGCTAYYCSVDSVSLHKGDKVLIQAAAGGVGSLLVQICQHFGCEIYGTASTSKLSYLKEIGVHHPIDYTKEKFTSHIKDGIDVAFDSIGGKTFKDAFKLLKPGGKMVYFGAAAQINGDKTNKLKAIGVGLGFGIFSPIPLLMKSQALIGVNMLRIADHKPNVLAHALSKVVDYTTNGIIKPKVGKIFKAKNIAEGHAYLESRKSIGKVVMEW